MMSQVRSHESICRMCSGSKSPCFFPSEAKYLEAAWILDQRVAFASRSDESLTGTRVQERSQNQYYKNSVKLLPKIMYSETLQKRHERVCTTFYPLTAVV